MLSNFFPLPWILCIYFFFKKALQINIYLHSCVPEAGGSREAQPREANTSTCAARSGRHLVADALRRAETSVSPFSSCHKHHNSFSSSERDQSHTRSFFLSWWHYSPVTSRGAEQLKSFTHRWLHFRGYLKRISPFQLDSARCETHKTGLWRKLLCYTISAHARPSDITITPPTQRKGKALPRGTGWT